MLLYRENRDIIRKKQFLTKKTLVQLKKNGIIYMKKKLKYLCITSFFIFTLLFYSPLELCAGSAHDIYFSAASYILVMGLASIVIGIALFMILQRLPEKIANIVGTVLFSIAFGGYVQENFLNRTLGIMNGQAYEWEKYKVQSLLDMIFWVLILVVPLLVFKFRREIAEKAICFLSISLIVMQLAGMITLPFNTKILQMGSKSKVIGSVTYDDVFSLSTNKNVVMFIIDTFDQRYIDQVYWDDPKYLECLNGFTYFSDSTSTYESTVPALTYLLTGQKYDYQISFEDYVEKSWDEAFMLSELKQKGFDTRILTDARYFGKNAYSLVDNLSKQKSKIKPFGLLKCMMRLSAYRCMPNVLKQPFNFDTTMINTYSINGDSHYTYNDEEFYNRFKKEGIQTSDSKGCLRIYHLDGTHPPYSYNREYENTGKTTTIVEVTEGVLTMLNNFMQEMKASGVYDNSIIIITADHGEPEPDGLTKATTPVFCIKPMNSDDSKSYEVSKAPISQENYEATIMKALGFDATLYGTSAYDASTEQGSNRFYYYEDNSSDDTKLVEYKIESPASDFNNWIKTGNVWDVWKD